MQTRSARVGPSDGCPSVEPLDPTIVAGRYELGPLRGRGASAVVYAATDRRCGRSVAVKLFAEGVDGLDRHRQDQELATLARLEHPGLVTLLDAGTENGRCYLVMELVDGPTLAERLRGGAMPVAWVVETGRRLAEALAHVHDHGVTHRDIKPANVLLDPGDRPLLADFGIALLLDATRVTSLDVVVGTAAYLAPEQVRGEPIGPPADIYALGLVLVEALAGRRAFPGTGAESVIARLSRGPDLPAGLPAELTDLLRAMTDDLPARRPEAAAVAVLLTDPGATSPAPRVGAARPVPAGDGVRRTRRRSLAAGLLVLALSAVAAGAVVMDLADPGTTGQATLAPPASAVGAAAVAPAPGATPAPVVPSAPVVSRSPTAAPAAGPGTTQAPSRVAARSGGSGAPPTSLPETRGGADDRRARSDSDAGSGSGSDGSGSDGPGSGSGGSGSGGGDG